MAGLCGEAVREVVAWSEGGLAVSFAHALAEFRPAFALSLDRAGFFVLVMEKLITELPYMFHWMSEMDRETCKVIEATLITYLEKNSHTND